MNIALSCHIQNNMFICVAWTNYDVRAVMYLRDDDDYYLYDEENQIIGIAKGEELDDISQEERERIRAIKEDRSK